MHSLEVGQLYHPERTQWPERAQYNYDANGHTLTLFFGDPKDSEVSTVKKGRWQFGLFLQRPLLFLCYRAKHMRRSAIPWSDAPYHWENVPAERRQRPPELQDAERATLQIILVDAATGIVRALRRISLSPEFSHHLHEAIRHQADDDWEGSADQAARDAYQAHPDVASMVKAAESTCWGGD